MNRFLGQLREIELTNLKALVIGCWHSAETNTSKLIPVKYPALDEEKITFLFGGEFRESIQSASSTGLVARAFIKDLLRAAPELDYNAQRRLSGLVARVNFHNRRHEGANSGADLGIAIRRPVLHLRSNRTRIEINRNHATGLLSQAKLGSSKRNAKRFTWNGLTEPQEKLFPLRRDYYSLLLYRLSGLKRDQLDPFGWQLCKDHQLTEVKE